ncbi:DNA polymerase/3'-5' exonuclease PolX [Bacillus sp. RG28]|uniref:DNA-directed DNA polymerase n=1 Tax=Gottfriedia endophytica TaxID=2820819 RepID=A0A940NK62_9BACI|nr:DNA polymerase/3'-5' exonuclease PolX [Gottfriedia endophytica]MBP0723996.1 DNA polymerase/3'-5' exonuclease PolX [Gottfriedia endophytica]
MFLHKKDVIKLLEQIAIYMELKGENVFKISAFRKAANALETDERSLEQIDDLTVIKGIGKGTSEVILEFIQTGKSTVLEELQASLPSTLLPMLKLPGLGGKKVAKLYQELNIENIEQLKIACENGMLQGLAGFGKKTEKNILDAIEEFGKQPERLPIADVLPIAEQIESYLSGMKDVVNFSRAGSLRRARETVKDLDFIISTDHPQSIKEQLLAFPSIVRTIAQGDTKVSVVVKGREYEISVDFRIIQPKEFATTLHHFTGSKDHNVAMRQLAKERDEKISEYGVENVLTGEVKTFQTEEEFYAHFDLPCFPPEVREDGKEVSGFTKDYPIIQLSHIKSDLHMHSTWSDGGHSIEEMVEACIEQGYTYMVITDHSQYLKVANGLTPERLWKQKEEIQRLNEKYNDITILHGVEMDILPDGSLDYEDDVLRSLDFVIGSIHSSFSQDEETIMTRLKNAMINPYVSMIAHPTGRLIGRRSGYKVNAEELIAVAKETGTILELNANPNRLDLNTEMLKMAQDAGVFVAINTDAHNKDMLAHMSVGVSAAKKAWMKKDNIVNTWELPKLLNYIEQRRNRK